MEYKKGLGWLASTILAILIVGTVAFIVFKSIGVSVTSIFEDLKKRVGIETKAEASTKKLEGCIVKRYYWSKNNVKASEQVNIIIEGGGDCDGKSVNINVFKDVFLWFDGQSKSINAPFKDTTIKVNWPTNEKGKHYFTLKFGDYNSEESGRLKVE